MRLILPVLGVTTLLVLGCSGLGQRPVVQAEPAWASYPQRVDGLVGKRVHEATEWLGTPSLIEDLAADAKRYTWDWRGNGAIAAAAGSKVPGFDCLTVIEADETGKITSAHAEGTSCIGVPPRKGPQDAAPEAAIEEPVDAAPATGGATAPSGGGRPRTPRPATPSGDEGPIRVHRAGNVDPMNGGSAEPDKDAPTPP